MSSSTTLRCTLTKIPTTANLLQRCRLPFGLHIFPFGVDDPDVPVPVISDSPIVRCRSCRTYINPYIRLVDHGRWQCNICQRVSDIPTAFYHDAHTKKQIDIRSRPELNCTSVEFMASTDYLVRPPQPACYMFVFERSSHALNIGYIPVLAKCIAGCLDDIPGDARASIGFIAYDSNVHYYTFGEGRVTHLVAPDICDGNVFLPCSTDNILVKIDSQREMILDFLQEQLQNLISPCNALDIDEEVAASMTDGNSALGPAIRSAYEILAPIGGRITVIQAHIANHGNRDDGSVLSMREDINLEKKLKNDKHSESLTPLLNPSTDFYKKLALECTEHNIAVDVFNLSTQYSDLATISSLARCTAGSIYHYSAESTDIDGAHIYSGTQRQEENDSANEKRPQSVLARFDYDLRHYLTRPLGLEAVLRLRCSRGLSIITFHGNFFVRSTDLLVLPNVNPDASYAMQISIDEDLRDSQTVSFQAAVLYTTPIGERRIRVHTATYPTVTTLSEVMYGADQEAIAAMLAKMAVDRSVQKSIGEANEAFIAAGVDLIEAYQLAEPSRAGYGLPNELSSIPLYVLALMKHSAFRLGGTYPTKVDDRIAAMDRLKTLPLHNIVSYIYPDLFPVHVPFDMTQSSPAALQLSSANIERTGAYLLDTYDNLILYVCQYIDPAWCYDVFGVNQYLEIPDYGDFIIASHTNASSNKNLASHSQSHLPSNTPNLYTNAHAHNFMMHTYGQANSYNQSNAPAHPNDLTNLSANSYLHHGNYQDHNHNSNAANSNSMYNNDNHAHSSDDSRRVGNELMATRKNSVSVSTGICDDFRALLEPLPEFDNSTSRSLREFIYYLIEGRPMAPKFYILRDDSRMKGLFLRYMIDDRSESQHSYYEFLQHLQNQVSR